jgi:hypothetical protein
MQREVVPEMLDLLPAGDLRAIRARQDLRMVNAWMGHARIMAQALSGAFADRSPRSIIELGAGDGTGLLRVAKRVASRWKSVRVVLVDRQQLVSTRTVSEFEALSWTVESRQMDVFEWLQRPGAGQSDAIVAGLFLHHFSEDDLRKLLQLAAGQTGFFLACEPHRDIASLAAARLLGLLGCNEVTKHDARVSVRAGFASHELSALWPLGGGWELTERHAGWFSHCFVAHRTCRSNC